MDGSRLAILLILAVAMLGCHRAPETARDAEQYNWSVTRQRPYMDRVSFATSPDLLHWTASGKIIADHASVPDALVREGTIHAYFVDVSTDGRPEQIGVVRSSDRGRTWTEREFVTFENLGRRVPVDPDPFLLPDGRIRLYFLDIEESRRGTGRIYSAVSTDGLNFVPEDGVRFEYPQVLDPDVVKVGNLWRLYAGTEQRRLISAASANGLEFRYEGTVLEGADVPNVFHDGTRYLLYTGGIDIYASADGRRFSRTGDFRSPAEPRADPGVVRLGDGQYGMVFKTSPSRPGGR